MALAASPVRAEAPDGGFIDYGCEAAPEASQVDGGWFLPGARERRLSCLMAACEAERDQLIANAGEVPVVAVSAGVAVGVIATIVALFAAGRLR